MLLFAEFGGVPMFKNLCCDCLRIGVRGNEGQVLTGREEDANVPAVGGKLGISSSFSKGLSSL